MRLTTHNGRAGRDGAYLASHNDRQFPTDRAEHIDQERSGENVYWNIYQDIITGGFANAEERFYRQHFNRALKAKNDRYQAQRHPERVQTMDEYYKSPRTCPEESIFQIGSIKDGTIDGKDLLAIYEEFKSWRKETFPAVHVLDYALHVDEQGAPHIHERVVWVGHDRDGNEIASQSKALKEMGVDRPRPREPQGRYNNPKQLYTSICREQALSICRAHGLNIEEKPLEASKTGLSKEEYQRRREQERAQELQNSIKKKRKRERTLQNRLEQVEDNLQTTTTELQNTTQALEQQRQHLHEVKGVLRELHTAEQNLQSVLTGTEQRILATNRRRELAAQRQLRELEEEWDR